MKKTYLCTHTVWLHHIEVEFNPNIDQGPVFLQECITRDPKFTLVIDCGGSSLPTTTREPLVISREIKKESFT